MCRIYGVTRDGFNSWVRRGKCARTLEDEELFESIHRLFRLHKGRYGSPKITLALREEGIAVGQKRVARIMRQKGLVARKAKVYPPKKRVTSMANACPNLIVDLKVNKPNQVWVGDVTYIKLSTGQWQYLSVIMDRFSRQVIGWSISSRRDVQLTLNTLDRAVRNRHYLTGTFFHSDKGSEYIATKFQSRLGYYGIAQSMNRKKEMNDNAHMESFFNNLKAEAICGVKLSSAKALRKIIQGYMRYYNHNRIHLSIGGVTPIDCEMRYYG